MMRAIETRGLSYRAGSFEIQSLDLHVPTGSIYGFLGPNGSGKTTTIRLLLGMARPRAGAISLLGRSVPAELPALLARIGYVPERPHVYPALTVAEALRMHGAFHSGARGSGRAASWRLRSGADSPPRRTGTWDGAWAERLRAQFALRPAQRVGRLSKGESGKLHMLLALAQRPELLILDEPTDGLDPSVRREVLEALLDYVGATGASVFISSHLVHELERMCDWIGVLDAGRLVSELPIAEFKGGVKRLRVDPPASDEPAPFTLLSRSANGLGAGEVWVVRGWSDEMAGYFTAGRGAVREVQDLDLEDVFVELLRAARQQS